MGLKSSLPSVENYIACYELLLLLAFIGLDGNLPKARGRYRRDVLVNRIPSEAARQRQKEIAALHSIDARHSDLTTQPMHFALRRG